MLSEELKLHILNQNCCLTVSSYSDSNYNDNKVFHTFIEGVGYGFLWVLENGLVNFIQFDSDISYEVFTISLVIFITVLMMLALVYSELISVDNRLIENGVNLSNGTGVLKEFAYSSDLMSSNTQRLLKIQREMIKLLISHELRTPISKTNALELEVVKDEISDPNLMTIDALEDDIEELNSLVDEVLTYGKLEEGSLNLQFEKINVKKTNQ